VTAHRVVHTYTDFGVMETHHHSRQVSRRRTRDTTYVRWRRQSG
jgi:hypothetical protein